MVIPGFFKFGGVYSVPLFSLIALYILTRKKQLSLRTHTFSKSYHFLLQPSDKLIFRLNFFVKALLDLGFALYVLNHLQIPIHSPAAIMILASGILFGSLSYFVEGKYSLIHGLIVYISGLFFAFGYIQVVQYIGNDALSQFTENMLIVPVLVGFSFLFVDKTDMRVQIICLGIWYFWLLVFVFQYL